MRISEAIAILEKLGSNSDFFNEIKKHNPNHWLVQCDIPDEDGKPKFFILEDTEENNRILAQHRVIDLNE
jgi:hypothetical protein